MASTIHIFEGSDTLYKQCAAQIMELIRSTLKQQKHFHIALAGGATPKGLYQELSRHKDNTFPHWSKVRFYFGDERHVAPDHMDSNFRMTDESLFQPLGIKDEAIQRIPGELEPQQVVDDYRNSLQQMPQQNGLPYFDLVLLGLGPDGHVASLFPGTELLRETREPFGAVFVDRLDSWRFSLTMPVINNAGRILLLVSGEKKADIVRHVLQCGRDAEDLPVEMLNPKKLEWYLDDSAAHLLKKEQAS